MKKSYKLALVALAASTITATGCNSFLTGEGLTNNPNQPTSATADQLFIAMQVAVMGDWESYPMNLLPLWVNQIAGVNRQWQSYAQFKSGTDNLTSDGLWISFYASGGLADIRRGETAAAANGNQKEVGQFRVIEALLMGTAADIFGDVPYDSALTPFPIFDPQAAVYAHVQAVLDSAITDLSGAGGGAGADFYYGNNFGQWTALAHTLKARFYMHTAENADLSYNNAILGQVLTETAAGISTVGGSFSTKHTTTTFETNLFYEFLVGSRAGDVEPGAEHINLAKQLNDNAELASLYSTNNQGQYVGSAAGASAGSNISTFIFPSDYSMGIVTYSENLLLSAEAHYRLGQAGPALTDYTTERAAYGDAGAPIPAGANGLLVGILEEKYVRNFLSPEVYFDYLRTCVPNIPIPANASTSFPFIPPRLPYSYTERTTNPKTPADPVANTAWPKHPTGPAGLVCSGQVGRP
ncbi:MAG: SusD/RagB family nutrient-binding outer membrane lipoprotein [Gemmatimonadaceae bacterium]